jgi:1-acyl-sn-glycerol-3-phosphate acyltransferase
VKVLGRENRDPKKTYVIVSNHQSLMDILVLFRTFFHFKWVSKKSMFRMPLLGWNMRLNGYIPIERGDAASREQCMERCREWIRKGSSVVFFPEGTRSPDGILRPFKLGAFHLALQTGSEILPIVIRGSGDAVPKHSILLTRKTRMSVEVLPAIPIQNFLSQPQDEAAQSLAQFTFDQVQRALSLPATHANPATQKNSLFAMKI